MVLGSRHILQIAPHAATKGLSSSTQCSHTVVANAMEKNVNQEFSDRSS